MWHLLERLQTARASKYISSCQEWCSRSRGLSFPSLQLTLSGPLSVSPFPESIQWKGSRAERIANVLFLLHFTSASLRPQTLKSPPVMLEIQVWFMGHKDSLEKGMAMHFSIFACWILWTEEPGRLQSMGPHRVRHDWVTDTFTFTGGLSNSKPPPKSSSRLGMWSCLTVRGTHRLDCLPLLQWTTNDQQRLLFLPLLSLS